jgi:hypothetical protein
MISLTNAILNEIGDRINAVQSICHTLMACDGKLGIHKLSGRPFVVMNEPVAFVCIDEQRLALTMLHHVSGEPPHDRQWHLEDQQCIENCVRTVVRLTKWRNDNRLL